MIKGRTYSIRIGRPGHGREDLNDPPFFNVEADAATLDKDGTLSIRSGKGKRVLQAQMWEICEIMRNAPSEGSS
jgi:hypothetical protein